MNIYIYIYIPKFQIVDFFFFFDNETFGFS